MSYPISLRPEAESEVRNAFQWYEQQVSGLGTSFLLSMDALLQAIQRNPRAYPEKYRGIRGAGLRRFPFVVYYIFEEGKIVVLAVFHAKRDPQGWKKRVDG